MIEKRLKSLRAKFDFSRGPKKTTASNKAMITLNIPQDKKITQKSYDEILGGLGCIVWSARAAGAPEDLRGMGVTGRGIKIRGELIKLRIVRVKCENCGKTHAPLPSYIVPYTRICLEERSEIVRQSEGERNYGAVMNGNALMPGNRADEGRSRVLDDELQSRIGISMRSIRA